MREVVDRARQLLDDVLRAPANRPSSSGTTSGAKFICVTLPDLFPTSPRCGCEPSKDLEHIASCDELLSFGLCISVCAIPLEFFAGSVVGSVGCHGLQAPPWLSQVRCWLCLLPWKDAFQIIGKERGKASQAEAHSLLRIDHGLKDRLMVQATMVRLTVMTKQMMTHPT